MWKKSLLNLIEIFGLLIIFSSCSNVHIYRPQNSNTNNGNSSSDVLPPVGGSVSFSQTDNITVVISWDAANDAVTVQNKLQYKLVKASSAEAINTAAKADAITGTDLVMDWTPNTTSKTVSGLLASSTYYFGVLVKDETGNKTLYLNVGWGNVGDPFSNINVGGLAIDSKDVPYVRTCSNDDNPTCTIMKFDGTSWTAVGDPFSNIDVGDLAIDSKDVPYVVTQSCDEFSTCTSTVMKLDGASWIAVGDPFSNIDVGDLAIDSKDVPYVVTQSCDEFSTCTSTVMKLDGASWIAVGDPFSNIDVGDPAIDSKDVPYVVTQSCDENSTCTFTVMKLDGTSWIAVGDPFSNIDVGHLAIDSKDVPYMATTSNDDNSTCTIMKFDGTSWIIVGDPFSSTPIGSLAFDSKDTPYITIENIDFTTGAVMKFGLVVPNITLANISVATPSFSIPGGVYGTDRSVTITDTTPEAVIHYTTDGTDPSTSGTAAVYSLPIPVVTGARMIQAVATKNNMSHSSEISAVYISNNYLPTINMANVSGGLTFPTSIDDSKHATVTSAYKIATTQTTYLLWYVVYQWAINNGYNFANPGQEGSRGIPGAGPTTLGQPVTTVSWYDSVVWTNALTEYYNYINSTAYGCVYKDTNHTPLRDATNTLVLDQVTPTPLANGFRLPTSNEYELAARYIGPSKPTTGQPIDDAAILMSGIYWTPSTYASGATDYAEDFVGNVNPNETATEAVAWYQGASPLVTPTGTDIVKGTIPRSPTALGLYDMSGNVLEWNFDLIYGSYRAIRGGAWNFSAYGLQVGSAFLYYASSAYDNYGFRFSRTDI